MYRYEFGVQLYKLDFFVNQGATVTERYRRYEVAFSPEAKIMNRIPEKSTEKKRALIHNDIA